TPRSCRRRSGCPHHPSTRGCCPARLRIQPSLDEENWLFEVPNTYTYDTDTVISGASLPNRPWLWSSGSVPSQVTVSSIQAIAYFGPIGWVHPNIGWFQVQVTTAQAGVVTGYMQRTITTNLVVLP